MSERIRKPALAPLPVRAAIARDSDPTDFLETHYRHIWQTQMHDLPFVNPALSVEALGFVRHDGDWLGVVVTPWFLNLFLLSGGGRLWGDIPAGERRYLELACGALQFIADDDPVIGPYQYCPLIAPVTAVADMATARQAALDALKAVFAVPPPSEPLAAPAKGKPEEHPRRGFLRRLAGRRPADR